MMKRYFTLIHILLIAGIIYLGASAVYKMTGLRATDQNADAPERQPPNRAAREAAKPPMSRYDPIIIRNLFQTEVNAAPEPGSVDLETLKKTELNLKLWGTAAGSGGQRAYAVIEDLALKTQKLYRMGDNIQGAEVRMIFREKVVLHVNGRDEVLQMDRQSRSDGERPSADSETPIGAAENAVAPHPQTDDAVENANELMKQARIRPHFQNGKPAGLVITRIRDNSVFSDLGLQNGDVLVGVDGKPIQSVDDAMQLYQGLKKSSGIKFQILRQGQEQEIEYQAQ